MARQATKRFINTQEPSNKNSGESFADMLNATMGLGSGLEGSVLKGRVLAIEGDNVIVDVGLKSEGRIPLREFAVPGQTAELKAGDMVEVFLERMEDRNGEAMLSREKAKREESWAVLDKAFADQQRVTGRMTVDVVDVLEAIEIDPMNGERL